MLSKTILEDCRRKRRNLDIAWIDYQKAFDSVPHSWVEKSTDLMGVLYPCDEDMVCDPNVAR
jgi:hypothetical protein